MVQIIPMERTPSPFQSLGAGLGQGLSQGINYGIQDMLQQKMNSRQNKSLLAALGPDVTKSLGLNESDIDKFSGLDPKVFMSVIDMKRQQMSLNDLATARMNSPLNKQYEEEFRQQAAQTPRNLAPGIAPMLEYQDIPAEEEAPIAQPSPVRMQSTRQEPEFKNIPYEDKKKQIEDYWNNLISSKPQIGAEKYIAAKERDLNNLRRDEELAQRTKSTSIKERVAEKELQELPRQLSTKLEKFSDMATRADQSLNAIENIDSLLARGAQLPEIITDINMKLGPENLFAKWATNLASNPLSKALETARVQQFTGMKDIFGGQIRLTEFNEFIKKLQDVRDPAITNKIKSVLLKQFANMERFPYLGLEKAVNENRNAPSDVILRKGKKYADEMAKQYATSSKKEMENIISEQKNAPMKQGFKSNNINDFKRIPEGHKVRTPSGEILTMRNGKLIKE